MPSLYESELRANGGAAEVDASRLSALGTELVNRSGLSLQSLWSKACGGEPDVELARLPERLSAAGAGAIGPRELGQLQRFIPAANHGRIGWQQWSAAFGLDAFAAPVSGTPTAGLPSPERNRLKDLPSRMPEVTPGGRRTEQDTPRSMPASETWPGGFREVDVQADVQSRLAISIASDRPQTPRKPPYGTIEDVGAPPSTRPLASPTYKTTTDCPPFAVGAGTSALGLPGRPLSIAPPSPSLRSPYAWDGSGSALATPSVRKPGEFAPPTATTTPFAAGGLWDR